jgi:hypothetical protein
MGDRIMRPILFAAVLVLLAGPAIAQDALTGTWNSDLGGATLKFDGSGSYTMTTPGEADYKGKYTLSGQSVTFEDAFGSQVCPGTQGIYNFNMIVNSVEFSAIDDFCTARRDRLRGTWTNAGML